MDIMVEFHSLWNLPTAQKLAAALEPFDTYWHEDPIRMDNLGDLATTPQPLRGLGLRLRDAGLRARPSASYLETGAAGIVMLDLSWCGGLSEARKIAAMAEA